MLLVSGPSESRGFDWAAPEGCPDAAVVRTRIEELTSAQLRAEVELSGSVSRGEAAAGFYELEKVPEPPWIVRAEELVRRVAP
jgi:hypothetical protein